MTHEAPEDSEAAGASGMRTNSQLHHRWMPAMRGWLIPSLLYIGLLGGLGVTTKVALRHLSWQDIIVWTAVAYAVIACLMLVLGQARIGLGAGMPAALGSGVLASTALVAFFIALSSGEASRVVPLTSAYPLVTMVLSVLILAERITLLRGIAALIVVFGIVLLSLSH